MTAPLTDTAATLMQKLEGLVMAALLMTLPLATLGFVLPSLG